MSTAPTPNTTDSGKRVIKFPRRTKRPNETSATFEARMALMEHLRELRDRLIRSVIGVAITTTLAFIFVEQLMSLFLNLAPAGVHIQVLKPTDTFGAYFKVALTFGLAAAMPLIVYQIFRFLSPGLKTNERNVLLTGLPIITVFFLSGVTFCYFVLLPPAINFLYSFGSSTIERNWQLNDFIGFVTNFVLAAGLAFQLPPVMYMLSKLHIVTAKKLSSFRRYAIILAAVAAAVITPTTDPFNMMLLAVPIYLLYELGVLMARFAR